MPYGAQGEGKVPTRIHPLRNYWLFDYYSHPSVLFPSFKVFFLCHVKT